MGCAATIKQYSHQQSSEHQPVYDLLRSLALSSLCLVAALAVEASSTSIQNGGTDGRSGFLPRGHSMQDCLHRVWVVSPIK